MSKHHSLANLIATKYYKQDRRAHKKHIAKITEKTHSPQGIFSSSTMKTYIKAGKAFARWVSDKYHPRTVEDTKQYVAEYLKM